MKQLTPNDLSFVIPSRTNLKYLRWAYDSIRKHGGVGIPICVADDASTDGTWEWCLQKMEEDKNFKAIRNEGPNRLGHTILYDKIVDELVDTEIFIIFHADMFLCSNAVDEILRLIEPQTVVSLTRIEPELHPPGPEKVIYDCGIEPEEFDEEKLISKYNELVIENKGKITEGVFAPWAIYKKDFQALGGHDPLFAPQSKEDSIKNDRLLFIIENNEIKLVRIEELFDKYVEYSEVDGGRSIIDFKKNDIKIATPTANDNQSVGRNYINKIIKKRNTKEMVRVRTMWGETICTTDHSLLDSNSNPVKPYELKSENVWQPLMINDWSRRTVIKKLDFDNDNVESFSNIDEYGNNNTLIDACEFLGFFVAEGSTHIDEINHRYSFSFDSNDLELLLYFKDKSLSLFPTLKYGSHIVSRKEDYKDVYKYTKSNKNLSYFLRELVGGDSGTKQVPDFIYNLPKAYQEAFLYGYLCGDGYLGTTISRQKTGECFSVDKRLMFNKQIFPWLTWKSTSKSDKLTAGINYLIRKCFPEIKIRINFPTENKDVYNISTVQEYRKDRLKIDNLGVLDCDVYDLEVERTHTFIDAMGLFGVHNSDIFNRFLLAGYKFKQTWEGYVYHMTCRGSRFKDGAKRNEDGQVFMVGRETDEWMTQNRISERNFMRKWGTNVIHDRLLKPIVAPKYDIGFIIWKIIPELLQHIEPLCSNLYYSSEITESENIIADYISREQPNTPYDLKSKFIPFNHETQYINDIIVVFDMGNINNNNYVYLSHQLPFDVKEQIKSNNNEVGFVYEKLPFQINVYNAENRVGDNIICKK